MGHWRYTLQMRTPRLAFGPAPALGLLPGVLLALLLALLPAAGAGAQPQREQRADVAKAVVNVSALRPGDKGMAAVVLDVKEGFHAQSRTPFDENLIKFD